MASFLRSWCQRSEHSPGDVRAVISDLIISLPASLFIDLGHFLRVDVDLTGEVDEVALGTGRS